MKKLKLAVIGQGRSGRDIHGRFYRSQENVLFDVAAVVEVDEERRQRALSEYPGCTVFADYRELFDHPELDLVVNASYSDQHYGITRDLLEHGFNVLVEKPFARNYYECAELMRAAKEKGVLLAVFQQTFLAPFYGFTKQVLDSGKLGDVKQISIRYNGLARRWDWQTLQCRMGGSVYNTGPHPLGMALDLLGYDDNTRVVYSKLDCALTSGDAEDYAKILLAAPGKPLVDVEINSTDAFSDYNLKIQGSRGTYKCTPGKYVMKYIVDGENPERPVIFESLKDENGYPIYCGEKLNVHEEQGEFDGDAFGVAVEKFYRMMYEALTCGKPLAIRPEDIAKIISVIETVHGQNPLPVRY